MAAVHQRSSSHRSTFPSARRAGGSERRKKRQPSPGIVGVVGDVGRGRYVKGHPFLIASDVINPRQRRNPKNAEKNLAFHARISNDSLSSDFGCDFFDSELLYRQTKHIHSLKGAQHSSPQMKYSTYNIYLYVIYCKIHCQFMFHIFPQDSALWSNRPAEPLARIPMPRGMPVSSCLAQSFSSCQAAFPVQIFHHSGIQDLQPLIMSDLTTEEELSNVLHLTFVR